MPEYPALGTLFVVKTPTWDGSLIRFVTGTQDQYTKSRWHDARVNHGGVFVGLIEGKSKPQMMEALGRGGFQYSDWDKYGSDAIWLHRIGQMQLDGSLIELNLSLDDRKTIVARARSIQGAPYNFLDLFAIALAQKRIRRWDPDYLDDVKHYMAVEPWWVKRIMNMRRFICSQAQDYSYMDVYCPQSKEKGLFADARPAGFVSPADILSLNIIADTPVLPDDMH